MITKSSLLVSFGLTMFFLFNASSHAHTPHRTQMYEPSSFWSLYAQYGYSHHNNDTQNRINRGTLFIADMEKWSEQNTIIPPHTFNSCPSLVRIATYNVRFWTDPLENPNVSAIMEVIKCINADVLILQESLWDEDILQSWGVNDLPTLFHEIGYVYGGPETLSRIIWRPDFRKYGTVIFSKFPLVNIESKIYEPTLPGADKQGYTHAQIHVNNTTVSIYGTHFAAESTAVNPPHAEDVRLEQIKQLTERMARDSTDNIFFTADCNAVRFKDFNYTVSGIPAWNLVDQDYRGYMGVPRPTHALAYLDVLGFKNSFDQLAIPTPKVTTWSGIPVDHIFLAKNWALKLDGSYLFFSAASDHCPIICDVVLTIQHE